MLNGCVPDKSKTDSEVTPIYHYNVILAPDLSNRVNMGIHPKPVEDQQIISLVLSMSKEILNQGYRETDQKDSYSFAFINSGLIRIYHVDQEALNLDFSKFPNQNQRMDFIKGRKKYEGNGLKEAIEIFKSECFNVYSKAVSEPHGADIWSFMQNRLDETQIKEAEKAFKYSGKFYRNDFRNILILITDGYIESGLNANSGGKTTGNLSYSLPQSRIQSFRNAYLSSGANNMKSFFEENGYGIVPLTNKNLENLEVLVLELYDRSLTKSGNATIHPTDADIIKLFWTDWLTKSKVKRFELKSCFSSEKQAKQAIKEFLFQN